MELDYRWWLKIHMWIGKRVGFGANLLAHVHIWPKLILWLNCTGKIFTGGGGGGWWGFSIAASFDSDEVTSGLGAVDNLIRINGGRSSWAQPSQFYSKSSQRPEGSLPTNNTTTDHHNFTWEISSSTLLLPLVKRKAGCFNRFVGRKSCSDQSPLTMESDFLYVGFHLCLPLFPSVRLSL